MVYKKFHGEKQNYVGAAEENWQINCQYSVLKHNQLENIFNTDKIMAQLKLNLLKRIKIFRVKED